MTQFIGGPRGTLGLAMLCAWNNIPPDKAPPEWSNHLNHPSRIAWERVADAARAHIKAEGK